MALAVLLLAAFGLRLYGLDWDEGRDLHPDELFITEIVLVGRIHLEWPPDLETLLDPATSGLNPRSVDPVTGEYRRYAYGALPLLVTDGVAEVMSWVTGRDWHASSRVYLVGRTLSAVLDTLTVCIVFLTARRVFGRRVALLAATVAALAPMSIQLAHFFTTDSWLTCFVALCLYASIRAAERGAIRWFIAAGGAFGLAMATKGSVFTLAGLLAVAVGYDVWRRWRDGEPPLTALAAAPERLAVAGIAAVIGFGLFEPFALAKPDVYLDNLREQAGVVRGTLDYPYTRVYVGTTPVAYQVEQLLKWGLGPVAGILSLAGLAVLARRVWGRWGAGETLVLAWFLGYGLVIAIPETKYLRYLAPLLPVLAISAGLALDALWRFVCRVGYPRLATAIVALLLVGAGFSTAAFISVYAHEHTRLEASRWIYANVPNGSALTAEYWDDTLPAPLAAGMTAADRQYEIVQFDIYNNRPPREAADYIYGVLEQTDYVVLSSDRLRSAIPRSPWRYAVQGRYYDLLEDGRLGFRLVKEFRGDPAVGPVTLSDTDADESLINYDHPRVRIYEKEHLVPRTVYEELMAPAIAQPFSPTRHPPRPSLLLDEPVGELAVVADARWSERVTGNSIAAILAWLVLLGVLQIVGWPLASLVFGRFADAGWTFARLIALLVAGYLVWIGASLQVIAFRAVWAGLVLLLVGACGWAARARWRRNRGLWQFRPFQSRVALGGEVVFWGVFALFLLFRYLNPDSWHPSWGGEKPMEFAHLNATLRSAHFPPYDPWYAGGYINYYYYGLYLVAFCFKLTGIPSEIAFNLAQPTIMALLASAGYGVAATLGRDLARRRDLAVAAGGLGALFLVGIGNLETWRLLLADGRAPFDSFDWTWTPSRAIDSDNTITEFPFFTGLYADLHAHVVALPVTVLAIALGYAIARDGRRLVLALSTHRGAGGARAVVGARLGLVALVVGTLGATNAWDVPAYAGLGVAAVLMASGTLWSWPVRLGVTVAIGALAAFLSYVLFLPFFSHYVALFSDLGRVREPTAIADFGSHLGGLLIVVGFGLVTVLSARRSPSTAPLAEPAIACFVVLALLAARSFAVSFDLQETIVDGLGTAAVVTVAAIVLLAAWGTSDRVRHTPRLSWIRLGQVGAATVVATSVLTDRVVLAFAVAFAAAALTVWLTGPSTGHRYVGLLVAGASLVIAGVELVFVVDDLAGGSHYRMNTVFKFYNQIWVLLALSAAAMTTKMLAEARLPRARELVRPARPPAGLGIVRGAPTFPLDVDRDDSESVWAAFVPARQRWARLGLAATTVALAASLAYPVFAIGPRLHQRFTDDLGSGTLNALDWMDYGTVISGTGQTMTFDGDRAAIDWLNANVAGTPVIAEASIGPYRGNGSRISIATGLPTILGWHRHEQQQRYLDDLGVREAEVHELYASLDPGGKLEILRRYNVEYVVVGEVEREWEWLEQPYAPAAGVAAFDEMVGTTLDIVFQQGGTTIFRVRPQTTATP